MTAPAAKPFVISFTALRDTKNFTVYQQDDNEMNKLYLPKGLPQTLTFVAQG